jgi:predicted AlkP superfamily pyrophosphatase or phosphodiesterase
VNVDLASRVLVIGIDGVRLDVLRATPTPNIDAVAEAGFLAPVRIDDATPTWSGPCWATIVTGVSAYKHGIYHNVFTGHRLAEYPDFLTMASMSGRRSYLSVGSWEPLATAACGGPLFAAPDRVTFTSFGTDCDRGDAAAVRDACRELVDADYAVSFVYLGDVDETGHEHGVGDLYTASLARADERVGRLTAALRSRPGFAGEGWTVILVTDHGHVDEGGHGGDSEWERTAWVAASGPGIEAGAEPGPVRHVDVTAHVYAALGMLDEMAAHPLEGKPFAAAI